LSRHSHDRVSRVIGVTHHLGRRNAHHGKPARFKPRVAAYVALRPIAQVVAHPIDLHGKPRLGAVEVEHVAPDRVLATEDWRSGLSRAQSAPQSRLGRRKMAT
jgi:hypothetical protein